MRNPIILLTMIKAIFSLFVVLAFAPTLFAQDCQCTDEFQFVKGYMEKNYAGFRDKVTPDTRGRYTLSALTSPGGSNWCITRPTVSD